ncbi:hypothetical protein [Singulisphaera sp. PoT]|uniref:hypothetical protein n=1 Tax=Singulisphaera sp. PoT TaxID=3411797 RepID=UPI003BF4A3F8
MSRRQHDPLAADKLRCVDLSLIEKSSRDTAESCLADSEASSNFVGDDRSYFRDEINMATPPADPGGEWRMSRGEPSGSPPEC